MNVQAGERVISSINVMWDSGSTVCLITFKKTRELELVGEKTMITIIKVGGEKEVIESNLYTVPIYDMSNRVEYFQAYGIQQISSTIEAIETAKYAKLLDGHKQVERPSGEVELLIGMEYSGYHPGRQKANHHLVYYENIFW